MNQVKHPAIKTTNTNWKYLLLAEIILTLFSGCNAYNDITAIADTETDFTAFRSFAWLPDKTDTAEMPFNNEIIRNNIRNYFGQSFAERGYEVNLDTPDLLLGLIFNNQKKEKTIVYSPYPTPYYYGRYFYGSMYYFPYYPDYYYRYPDPFFYPPEYYARRFEYMESSITLNVVDRKKNKLVWSGTANGDIFDLSYIDRDIHPAVEAIMKKFPTKPIKKQTD